MCEAWCLILERSLAGEVKVIDVNLLDSKSVKNRNQCCRLLIYNSLISRLGAVMSLRRFYRP